ncbi:MULTISPECIES: acyl-CoA dehydrogenase family protein [Actinokineospora]|uniref:Oxidoreductase n=1 Tax=Actinokineospora fastidiosa TaxID=1816 RepID=A0A918G804_9PSEU|nr:MULTISPECIES: acyl-CoA dehydrogenase family protein [Actinokineospora]UVS82011.1 sulfur acquisition oxidoreductase, SfnB family [Actinokineospora sp. UTMC 2448]GGS24153.1 putative oxidoreductase [Actinokineospora fastidiosa]
MRTLEAARAVCEQFHPGLVGALKELTWAEREKPGSPVIELFRAHEGVGLLVPREHGGAGADLVQAVQVMRALGSLSPSLAAAATMHHFTAATLYALAPTEGRLTGAQIDVLKSVVPDRRIMASGWAEGRTEQNILAPAVKAERVDGGYVLNGSKKPCSLSGSMDILTASIAVTGPTGEPELAMALIPADSPGITTHPFWGNDVLAAAESEEVRLTDVFITEDLVIRTTDEDPERMQALQLAGFVWFELLISAGYVGAAGALVEKVLERKRGGAQDQVQLAIRVESAYALLEGAARAVLDGVDGEEAVANALIARYGAQQLIAESTATALELLGGLDFITSADSARLASGVRPLAFHPPSRASVAESLIAYLGGEPLVLG